eukprot:jgi/Astpho2/5141/fgenesh1_pm.00073_%23_9_t
MTVTVHHLENSRSQRILWLLEELQIPYEIKHYARDPKTMVAPKELKAVHPLGKSPVITDGNLTVAESGLIVDYLVDKYGKGKLAPARSSEAQRLRYEFWLHYAEGSLAPLLVFGLVMNHAGDAAPWDVIMSFPVEVIQVRGTDFPASKYPKMHAFVERVHARPAYQVALQKGGKYDILK